MTVHSSYFPIIADPVQLAEAGPFTLSCVGEVIVDAPGLGTYPQQVTVLLGRFRRFGDAFACAKRRGRQHDLCMDRLSGFRPNLLIIEDAQKRLCLAGQIAPTGPFWCDPVTSDAEARQMVLEASRIRSQSVVAAEQGATTKAQALRFRAAALEARLVDPAWRTQPIAQVQAAYPLQSIPERRPPMVEYYPQFSCLLDVGSAENVASALKIHDALQEEAALETSTFDLKGLWGFQYANTCSRLRPNAFGGGAHVLDLATGETVGWIDSDGWLAAALDHA